jgi:hypothetical protein
VNKKTITALSIGAVAVIGAAVFGCDGFGIGAGNAPASAAKKLPFRRIHLILILSLK